MRCLFKHIIICEGNTNELVGRSINVVSLHEEMLINDLR